MVKIWRLKLNVVHVMRGGGGNSAGGVVCIRVFVGRASFESKPRTPVVLSESRQLCRVVKF